jgi:hypothetical protein
MRLQPWEEAILLKYLCASKDNNNYPSGFNSVITYDFGEQRICCLVRLSYCYLFWPFIQGTRSSWTAGFIEFIAFFIIAVVLIFLIFILVFFNLFKRLVLLVLWRKFVRTAVFWMSEITQIASLPLSSCILFHWNGLH